MQRSGTWQSRARLADVLSGDEHWVDAAAWAAVLLGVWLWTCLQLAPIWKAYSNYNFGYAVPWIAALLAVRSYAPSCFKAVHRGPPGVRLLVGIGFAAAWALFLFAELFRELDPHWRLVNWAMVFAATLLTALALFHRGGANLLRRFAFPLCFLWTAVPWPSSWEDAVTSNLRSFVTRLSVAGLHASGIQAVQHGNVIELANGTVSVDSACSGISSFQCGIMACLFLGEFFRLSVKRRFLLVAAGCFLAIAFNLVRAFLLVRIANDYGADALLAHHDQLGYGETVAIFLSVSLLGWCLSKRRDGEAKPAPAPADARFSVPGRYAGCVCLAAFAAIPLLTNVWFSMSPGGALKIQSAPQWALNPHPATASWSVQPMKLDPLDEYTLNFTEGQMVQVDGPGELSAQVTHFFWLTDSGISPLEHTPDTCMVGSGWRQVGETCDLTLRGLPGKYYEFEQDGFLTGVFQTISYGNEPVLGVDARGSRISRLSHLWRQPRRRGIEAVTIYMTSRAPKSPPIPAFQEVLANVLVPSR